MTTHRPKDTNNNQGFILGILASIFLVFILLIGTGIIMARKLSSNSIAQFAASITQLGIAEVNDEKITYADYLQDVKTLRKFYQDATGQFGQISDEELSNQALSRQIANIIIRQIAKEQGVSVTNEDIEDAKSTLFSQFESEAKAREELKEKYGWSMGVYTKKVIIPMLLEQKLAEHFQTRTDEEVQGYSQIEQVRASHILLKTTDETEADVQKLATELLQQLKDGADFSALALKYGTDATAQQGGDLGWFGKGVMIPAFEEVVFKLKEGQLNDQPLKTEFGYHIILKSGKRFLRSFDEFLTDKIKEADIDLLMKVENPFDRLDQPIENE